MSSVDILSKKSGNEKDFKNRSIESTKDIHYI